MLVVFHSACLAGGRFDQGAGAEAHLSTHVDVPPTSKMSSHYTNYVFLPVISSQRPIRLVNNVTGRMCLFVSEV